MNNRQRQAGGGNGEAASARSSLPPLGNRLTLREQIIALLLLSILMLYYSGDYTQISFQYLEQTSQRSLAMFAIARGLNAAISVIQSVEFGFTLGVSAMLSPGEVLDPLNDLIERFSLVMLVASVALWIIRLCGGILLNSGLLWGVVSLFAASIVLTRSQYSLINSLGRLFQWVSSVFLGLLAFALFTPLLVELVHENRYVATNYEASSSGLRQAQAKLEVMSREIDSSGGTTPGDALAEEECSGWAACLDAFGERLSGMSDNVAGVAALGNRVQALVEEARRTATEASRQVVIQIAIFILETLLIPIAGLWLCWRLLMRRK